MKAPFCIIFFFTVNTCFGSNFLLNKPKTPGKLDETGIRRRKCGVFLEKYGVLRTHHIMITKKDK